MIGEIRMGDVADFRNFMGAVIDERAFEPTRGYIELAKTRPGRDDPRGRRDATTRWAGSSSPRWCR